MAARFREQRIRDQFLKYPGHGDVKCEDLGSRRYFYRRVRVPSPIVVEEELMLVAVQAKVQVVKEVPGVDPRHSLHLESIPITNH